MEERELEVVVEHVTEAPARKGLRRTAVAGGGIMALALVGAALGLSPIVAFVMLGLGGIALRAGLGRAARETHPRTRTQTVRLTETALETEDTSIPLSWIARAYVEPHGGERPHVVLEDRFGNALFEAIVDDRSAGDDLLRALQQRDVQHRRQTFTTGGKTTTHEGLALLAIATTFLSGFGIDAALQWLGLGPGTSLLVAIGCCVALFVLAIRPTRVEIAADGLLVRWLGMTRYVRWSEIESVDQARSDVIRLTVKGQRELRIKDTASSEARDPRSNHSLRGPILEAWKAYRLRAGEPPVYEQLAQSSRGIGEWRRALASLRSADGYRQTATRDEDLWRVVEDARAPEDARAAAALALRSADTAPVRLRVAAESVASPRLRIALETAANQEAEDDALDEALARVAKAQA